MKIYDNTVEEDLDPIDNNSDLLIDDWGSLKRNPNTFSFGELKFLQLMLLPVETEILLFDEPLLGLHSGLFPLILDVLNRISKTGRYVIACSEMGVIDIQEYVKNVNILNIPTR